MVIIQGSTLFGCECVKIWPQCVQPGVSSCSFSSDMTAYQPHVPSTLFHQASFIFSFLISFSNRRLYLVFHCYTRQHQYIRIFTFFYHKLFATPFTEYLVTTAKLKETFLGNFKIVSCFKTKKPLTFSMSFKIVDLSFLSFKL